jgi:hypothetical protein
VSLEVFVEDICNKSRVSLLQACVIMQLEPGRRSDFSKVNQVRFVALWVPFRDLMEGLMCSASHGFKGLTLEL